MSDKKNIAEIAINIAVRENFHYRAPGDIAGALKPGARVRIPFGNKVVTGYFVQFIASSPYERKLRDIISVVDTEPLIDEKLFELAQWIAAYYRSSLGEALECILPKGVRKDVKEQKKYVALAASEKEIAEFLRTCERRSPDYCTIVTALKDAEEPLRPRELAEAALTRVSKVYALVKKGVLKYVDADKVKEESALERMQKKTFLPLNAAQQKAFEEICAGITSGKFTPIVLYGVTDSGKTEVYLHALREALADGKQAIILVPEIALTPQTISRFRARFKNIAVLHSYLTDSDRNYEWRKIRSGEADVIIGARSAVFAPARNLGLIIIDEEHETSFKQDTAPRYHARDVALVRAQMLGIPVVMGSATPSLESYHNARKGKFTLARLPERVEARPFPPVEIIDMRGEYALMKRNEAISPRLHGHILKTLEQGSQVILLLNRRGFSRSIICRRCGLVLKCKRCDIALTFHKKRDVGVCHYCDYTMRIPEKCPDCGFEGLRHKGIGTERLEEELARKFPTANLRRMDSDVMTSGTLYEQVFSEFAAGDVDILLGTQMIAKGLDFPNVTLVGVINADTALYLPDFRASERTFQLLSQVAGRSGRGEKGGVVVVQTYNPESFTIQRVCEHDYFGFAEKELEMRKALGYPPFSRVGRILLQGADQKKVRTNALKLGDTIRTQTAKEKGVSMVGCAPCPISKLKNKYRYHIIIQAKTAKHLRGILDAVETDTPKTTAVRMTVDVDPVSLL